MIFYIEDDLGDVRSFLNLIKIKPVKGLGLLADQGIPLTQCHIILLPNKNTGDEDNIRLLQKDFPDVSFHYDPTFYSSEAALLDFLLNVTQKGDIVIFDNWLELDYNSRQGYMIANHFKGKASDRIVILMSKHDLTATDVHFIFNQSRLDKIFSKEVNVTLGIAKLMESSATNSGTDKLKNLSPKTLMVLKKIVDATESSTSQLAQKFEQSPQAISPILKELEQQGFVKISRKQGRSIFYYVPDHIKSLL